MVCISGRFSILNTLEYLKAIFPSLIVWRWGRSFHYFIHIFILIKENDGAETSYSTVLPLKHPWPISMDWREVKSNISNDVVIWNELSPSLTDWRLGRSIHQQYQSFTLVIENDDVPLKQLTPISIDSSDSNCVKLNELADWNAVVFRLNDFNDVISIL